MSCQSDRFLCYCHPQNNSYYHICMWPVLCWVDQTQPYHFLEVKVAHSLSRYERERERVCVWGGGEYPLGTTVSVICNSGLRKVGNTLTCLSNGVWNSTLPTCEGEWNDSSIHLNDYTNYMSRAPHSFFTWHHIVYYIM